MIERSESDGILTIRIAHGKASALDVELVEGLALAFAEAAGSDARAIILTGTGSIFSAGVDLFRITNGGKEYVDRFGPAMTRMFLDLFTLPKPVIAAVNGHAIAGGCILAACSDVRLMAAGNGRIGVPELMVGVAFPPAILEMLRFSLPPQHLQMIIYGAATYLPDDALRVGLIDEVVAPDALLTRANELARHLISLPEKAFRYTKRQLREHSVHHAHRYAGKYDDEVNALWADEATHEHIRKYLERTVHRK